MSHARGRNRSCTVTEARARCAQARSYLETAKLVRSDTAGRQSSEFDHVAAGNAVLAAIAASDALCCRLLSERARGQDHRQAVDLIEKIRFGEGTEAAQARRAAGLGRALAAALDVKDESHYGTHTVSATQVLRVIRAAEQLVKAAELVV